MKYLLQIMEFKYNMLAMIISTYKFEKSLDIMHL